MQTLNVESRRAVALTLAGILVATVALLAQAQRLNAPNRAGQMSLGKSADTTGRVLTGSVLKNNRGASPTNADPLFLPPVIFQSELPENWVTTVADLNGDGKLDVITGNLVSPAAVTVWLGNGDGTFQSAITVTMNSSYYTDSIDVADVNGDGKPDLAVSAVNSLNGQGTGEAWIQLGNGDGTFQNPSFGIGTTAEARWIRFADLNGDHKADVLVATAQGVQVLMGNGDGTFQVLPFVRVGDNGVYRLAVADLNHDGKPDVMVEDVGTARVFVLLGNGDGTFTTAVGYSTGPAGYLPWATSVADLNGDGKLDMAVSNQCVLKHCTQGVAVMLGNGDGTFGAPTLYDSTSASPTSPIAIADVNGDGKLDLLYCPNAYNVPGLAVFLGNGDGTFQPAVYFNGGGGPVAADFNGDGRPDVVSPYGNSGMDIVINNTGPHQPSTVALRSDAEPAPINQLLTYTATVTSEYSGEISGTVTFTDRGKAIGTAPVVSGTASITHSYPKTGQHPVVATYSGDYHSSGSTSSIYIEYIETLPVTSATHVTTSGSPSHAGQPVTFTASVSSFFGKVQDGDLVTFSDGTAVIGTVPVAHGVATFTTSSLTVKKHTIKAVFGGDGVFKASSGHVLQVVQP